MKTGILKNRSIRQRLLSSSIIITILPMIMLVVVFGIRTGRAEFRQTVEEAEALADRLIENFSFEMEKAELMVNTLAEFSPLQTYLYTEFDSYEEEFRYYTEIIHPMAAGYNNSQGSTRIRIYHNEPHPNYSLELNNDLKGFIARNFTEDPFKKGSSFWVHLGNCYPFHPVLSYFRTVQDSVSKYDTAYVVSVHLKEKAFSSYLQEIPPETTLLLLTDQQGNILTSNEASFSGKTAAETGLTEALRAAGKGVEERIRLNGKSYYLISRASGILRLYVLVSDREMKRTLFSSVFYMVLLGTGLFLLSALLLSYSTGRITGGISTLMNKMQDVDRGSIHLLAKDETVENSEDEIVRLDSAFTRMMRRIDTLVDQVQQDEARLKDEIISRQQAELSYLQQQINPHYLFNTLEAIRMNLILKGDSEDAAIIKIFAESFRRYMDLRDKEVTLFEETAFLEKYISIQNYRLGNKIDYRLEAKESVLGTMILKLLIQPLVENSVVHGFEEKAERCSIVVSITKDAEFLTVRVSDNGGGIGPERLAELRRTICGETGGRAIGLQNVYRRIRLYYGPAADLRIDSREGEGSTATLLIPLRRTENV